MKKLLTSLMLTLGLAIAVQSQSIGVWSIHSNVATNLIISGGVNVKTITVSAFGAIPAFYFYDYNTNQSNPFGTFQYSNTTAFSNLVTFEGVTNSVIFTNSVGRVNTNQYVGRVSHWTNVATATASNSPIIGSFATQSGIPYTVGVNWNLVNGLSVRGTNNASAVIIIEYQ